MIRLYKTDHPPLHVHVFHDAREVARYDIEHGEFMAGSDRRHFGRILHALKDAGLID